MSELNNHYQKIIKELKEKVKDKEEKEFVLSKIQELSMMFMDVIDRLTSLTEIKINEIEKEQKYIQSKVEKVQKKVENIENDIYEDDSYEYEIVCPYCNHEFLTYVDDDTHNEIECPECHNVIELNWDNVECEHECSGCTNNCVAEEECNYKENAINEDEILKNNSEDEDM